VSTFITSLSRIIIPGRILHGKSNASHSLNDLTTTFLHQQYYLLLLKNNLDPTFMSGIRANVIPKKQIKIFNRDAIQSLLTQGYLRCVLPIWLIPLCLFLILIHPKLQVWLFQITVKGKNAVACAEVALTKKRAILSNELNTYFHKADLSSALKIIRSYARTQLRWSDTQFRYPSKLQQLAAKIVLTNGIQITKRVQISAGNLQVLQYQAAELLLSGQLISDRLSEISTPLHPRGNQWLVYKLCKYGLSRAQSLLNKKNDLRVINNIQDSQSDKAPSNQSLTSVPDFGTLLPKIRIPMRLKITLPYVFLALVFAGIGAYLISQVVLETLQERFTNQLIEVGKLSADRMVIEEDARLETLRLLANTNGVADALATGNAERLREIALPIAVNAREEAIEFVDLQGVSVLSLRHRSTDRDEDYVSTRGDTSFKTWDIFQKITQGIIDPLGDKYAAVVNATWGDYFYISGPVKTSDGKRVGVVLVGKTLQTLVRQFREQTLAQTTFYNLQGTPLVSTLLTGSETLPKLGPQEIADVLNNQASSSLMRDLSIASIHYSELMGPWTVRNSSQLGVIGAALPRTFLTQPSDATRIEIFFLVALGLLVVIGVGLYVSRRITRPLLQVVDASAQVAKGNLDISVEPVGNDEIAVLAHAFNHMMAGLRDATERKLREIELMKALEHERELRELKSRFVSMVSHEFRTPLATILSSTEYIETYGHEVPYPKRQKHFKRIQGAVTNMTRLLEDVLIIGKTESDRLEFNPSLIEVAQFCKELVDEIQTSAGERHSIRHQATGQDTKIFVDEKLLRVAISNLLTNAIKYSPNGGNVYFEMICEAEYVLFRVRDTGIGIPEKDQKRLFETFHRASNVSNISGTGLGLYITKMAVELHDGVISFESQPDIGTTFTIIIPARRDEKHD
jgi:signal transduction histidine kinase